jgi:hypothetical protein
MFMCKRALTYPFLQQYITIWRAQRLWLLSKYESIYMYNETYFGRWALGGVPVRAVVAPSKTFHTLSFVALVVAEISHHASPVNWGIALGHCETFDWYHDVEYHPQKVGKCQGRSALGCALSRRVTRRIDYGMFVCAPSLRRIRTS